MKIVTVKEENQSKILLELQFTKEHFSNNHDNEIHTWNNNV